MRRTFVQAWCSLALVVPSAALAQQDNGGRFSFVFVLTPKPGMAKQMEDALKKHTAWHVQAKDKRAFSIGVVAAGHDVGTYRVVYGNLRWQDQDDAAPIMGPDLADVNLNIGPVLESVKSYVALRMDSLSRIPVTEPAKAMNWVVWTYVKAGKGPEYTAYLRKLREAHDKANSPYRYFVLSMVLGDDTPAYAIVRPADKWAEFTPAQNRQVLVAAFGELEADRLLNVLDETVSHTRSFVTVNRPDLSYRPTP